MIFSSLRLLLIYAAGSLAGIGAALLVADFAQRVLCLLLQRACWQLPRGRIIVIGFVAANVVMALLYWATSANGPLD